MQVVGAMCTLLALVLARVPASVLRSKFIASSQIIVSVIEQSNEQVILLQLLQSSCCCTYSA